MVMSSIHIQDIKSVRALLPEVKKKKINERFSIKNKISDAFSVPPHKKKVE